MIVAVLVWGVAIALFGLSTFSFALALVFLAIAGAADVLSAVFRSTMALRSLRSARRWNCHSPRTHASQASRTTTIAKRTQRRLARNDRDLTPKRLRGCPRRRYGGSVDRAAPRMDT